jgi:hypothetical protein
MADLVVHTGWTQGECEVTPGLLGRLWAQLPRATDFHDFIVVTRPSTGEFLQVLGHEDPYLPYLVERHDPAAGEVYHAFHRDPRVLEQTMNGWAYDLPGWQDLVTWKRGQA